MPLNVTFATFIHPNVWLPCRNKHNRAWPLYCPTIVPVGMNFDSSLSAHDKEPVKMDFESGKILSPLYEDQYILAMNKPSGVRVAPKHRFQGESALSTVLAYLHLRQQMSLGIGQFSVWSVPLHRIDVHTSGVVMFAKDPIIVPKIHQAFREGAIQKSYLAIVDGTPVEDEFIIDAPIVDMKEPLSSSESSNPGLIKKIAHRKSLRRIAIDDSDPETIAQLLDNTDRIKIKYKASRTLVRVLERGTNSRTRLSFSYLLVKPLTGRTHQIRVHLKHAGFPIVGDDCYGREAALFMDDQDMLRNSGTRFCDNDPLRAGLKLHAMELAFTHPLTGHNLTICAPSPFDGVLPNFGLG